MLEKTVKIGDTDVKFRSSASVPRLYRIKFGRDIFKDLSKLEKSYKEKASEDGSSMEIEDLEIFDNIEGVFGIGGYGLYTYCLDNLDREQYKEGLEVARELGVDKDTYDSGEGFLLEILQKCVADDDAIIFIESGHEKLNYVAGCGTIITSKQIEHVDLLGVVLRKADEILGNPDWHKNTRVDY